MVTIKRKQLAFDLDLATHQRVKICAAIHDISMALLIHQAILKHMKDLESIDPKKIDLKTKP